jgi:hypothetical protein
LISVHHPDTATALGHVSAFRQEFYTCLSRRADALFELTDAVLCFDGPIRSLVETCLAAEHRRGHGSLYAALNHGQVEIARLRRTLTSFPVPRAAGGRLVLAVDVTSWLRPEAHTSRSGSCATPTAAAKTPTSWSPAGPHSVVCALETGRHSWTAPLDAQRLAPSDDAATVTATQLRQVVTDLITARQWQPDDPDILIVADAGYDGPRLSFLLSDLPVAVLVRMRSDRVLRRPAPPHTPQTKGRPRRHGGEFVFGDPATWGEPDITTHTDTRLYGSARARAWDRLHPRLTHRTAWLTHAGSLPILEGTVILLEVTRLPSDAIPKPVWLWYSRINQTVSDTDRLWQTFLRRFDIEHTFRMFKQTLGWTAPKLRTPEVADRWTWLILAAYTQLRLARQLAADLRRPWEKPVPSERLSPARVRRTFRNLRPQASCPAAAPKPSRPGPGRPAGDRNQRSADRHDVHTVTTTTTKKPKSGTPRPRRKG